MKKITVKKNHKLNLSSNVVLSEKIIGNFSKDRVAVLLKFFFNSYILKLKAKKWLKMYNKYQLSTNCPKHI